MDLAASRSMRARIFDAMDSWSRLTGRAGAYTLGLLNIQAGEDQDLEALSTNFSVVRLRRDIFRRSTIGVMATNRSVTKDGIGSNQAYGVDANFSFFQNLNITSSYAATQTPDLDGDNTSYMASIRNEGDRYGFTYQHLMVGKNFNPEVGFVRREDFRKNRGELQFTPRPLRRLQRRTRNRPPRLPTPRKPRHRRQIHEAVQVLSVLGAGFTLEPPGLP